jgi:hypothetical protein
MCAERGGRLRALDSEKGLRRDRRGAKVVLERVRGRVS